MLCDSQMSVRVFLRIISSGSFAPCDYVADWEGIEGRHFWVLRKNWNAKSVQNRTYLHAKVSNPEERRKCDDIFALIYRDLIFNAQEIEFL